MQEQGILPRICGHTSRLTQKQHSLKLETVEPNMSATVWVGCSWMENEWCESLNCDWLFNLHPKEKKNTAGNHKQGCQHGAVFAAHLRAQTRHDTYTTLWSQKGFLHKHDMEAHCLTLDFGWIWIVLNDSIRGFLGLLALQKSLVQKYLRSFKIRINMHLWMKLNRLTFFSPFFLASLFRFTHRF